MDFEIHDSQEKSKTRKKRLCGYHHRQGFVGTGSCASIHGSCVWGYLQDFRIMGDGAAVRGDKTRNLFKGENKRTAYSESRETRVAIVSLSIEKVMRV